MALGYAEELEAPNRLMAHDASCGTQGERECSWNDSNYSALKDFSYKFGVYGSAQDHSLLLNVVKHSCNKPWSFPLQKILQSSKNLKIYAAGTKDGQVRRQQPDTSEFFISLRGSDSFCLMSLLQLWSKGVILREKRLFHS